jgi:hypothetical protein
MNEMELGVYVDGSWGQYGVARAILLAHSLGWKPMDHREVYANALTKLHAGGSETLETVNDARAHADLRAITSVYDEIDYDVLDTDLEFAHDDAVDWLNMEAPDGRYWGWEDGDFGLWIVEDDA